jgi:ABC-type sugar transport system permease subunit
MAGSDSSAVAVPRTRTRAAARRRRRHVLPYVLLAPTAVLLIGLYGAPFVSLFYYALRNYSLSGASKYVGFGNLTGLFQEDRFRHDLVVTAIYLVGVLVLSLPIAYAAAVVVSRKARGIALLRTVLLIPWVLAPVVTALLFRTLIDPVQGPLSKAVSAIAGHPVYLSSNATDALTVVIVHAAWRSFPLEMLLLAAAISGIPRELYEAVRVDGAGRWREFRHITLPMTRQALISACIVIGVFTIQDAEGLYSLTQGGPGYGTESTAVRLFKEAFLYYNVGGGAAIGVILVAVTLVVLLLLFWLSRRIEAS